MPRLGAADILGYVPPELHEGKEWFVDFYARDAAGQLRRKRIKVNRVKGATARRAYARQLMAEVNRRLAAGWSPWAASEPAQGWVTLDQALDQWDRSKERQLRHSSPYSYTSMTSIFREWCRGQGLLEKYVSAFTSAHAAAYMHYVGDERLVRNVTYNNHRTYLRMVWSYFVERKLAADDPFKHIKRRKRQRKTRSYLTPDERRQMVAWTNRHDPNFLLPLLLVYGCLIRPGELKRLKVAHVDMERQVVHLPAELTKSGTERSPAIPDWLLPYLEAAGIGTMPGKAWLIGQKLVPGDKPIARNTLNRHWVELRSGLGWDNTKQLYSLRDTGIIQLLRDGVDLLHVMQQAGHAEVGTTNTYLKHAFPQGPAEVRSKATPITAASSIEG